MSKKLTYQQKHDYMASYGVKCPFCDSYDIKGYDIEINEGVATQLVSCEQCNEDWTDVYTLTSIEQDDYDE